MGRFEGALPLPKAEALLRHWSVILALTALTLATLTSALAAPITVEQAQRAVINWLVLDARPLGAEMSPALGQVQPFYDESGEAIYYVVNLEPEGYVIVSADDGVEPIIAFSPAGRFDPNPANPLYNLATRDLTGRTQYVRSLPEGYKAPVGDALSPKQKWEMLLAERLLVQGLGSISDIRVDKLVQSKWSQENECGNACYNYYVPPGPDGSTGNYPCGCVATAMAQVLRYWQYPTAGIGIRSYKITICGGSSQWKNTRGGDGSGGPYVWSNMPLDPGCGTTLAQRQQIGALCYDCGISVNMDYCSGGSGISDLMKCVASFRNLFGYAGIRYVFNNNSQLPTASMRKALNASLHAGWPCMMGIAGYLGGHLVVCDGYGYNASTMYHHVNMGWAGAEDAWYNLPDIDSDPPFDVVAGIHYNISPTISGEIIAGRVTDVNGVPLEGVTVAAGAASDVTDSRGIYALTGLASNTNYTVTATKTGYSFQPQNVTTGRSTDNTTSVGNLIDVDFQGRLGAIVTTLSNLSINEGSTASFGVKLDRAPSGDTTVTVARVSGDPDITVQSGATLVFTTANWNTYQNVTIAASEDVDAIDGSAVIRCSATGWESADVNAAEADNDKAILTNVDSLYVYEGATGVFNVKLKGQPAGDVVVSVARISGDTDITVQSGSSLTFTPSNWNTYQPVILAAALDPDALNGVAVIRCSAGGWTSKDVTATEWDKDGSPDTEPPTVPTGLSAVAVSSTQIDLAWNPSTDNVGVTGYKIYRDGSYKDTCYTTSYSDTTCLPNTTYTYRVAAFDAANNQSAQSSPAQATTLLPADIIIDDLDPECSWTGTWTSGTRSGAWPSSGGVNEYKYTTVATPATATYTWRPNIPWTGNYDVYIYYLAGSNRTTQARFTVSYSGGSDTVLVNQQINGQTWYRIATAKPFASGTAGYVRLTNEGSGVDLTVIADAVKFVYVGSGPPDTEPPTVPTNLSAVASSPVQIDLSWTPSTDNFYVAGYKVYRNGSFLNTTTTNGYSDTSCNPGTYYTYRVSAYDPSQNESAQSDPASATTPSAPEYIIDDLDSQTSYTGTWTSGTYAGGWPTNASQYKWASTTSTSTFTWQPNLPEGRYNISIWYLQGGNRSTAAPFTISYLGGSQNVNVNQTINGSQWYLIATDKPFAAGSAGYVRLSSYTGESGKCVIADAVKWTYLGPLAVPPAAPSDGIPVVNSTTSITWKWTDVANETGYRVKDTGGVNKSGDLPANTIQWTETGLTPNTQYTRRIYAFNAYGESGGSTGQTKYTLAKAGESTDGTGATGNVYCTNATKNTWYGIGKTFTFSNPAGFGTGGTWKASKFEYKWNKSPTESWSTAGTIWNSGTISLTADAGDGDYYLHVRAFNGENVPNNTDVLDYGPFKSDQTAPAPVTVTDEGTYTPSLNTLKASWTASSDSGSGLQLYEYAIGTSPTTQNVKNWSANGLSTSVTIGGLSLIEGSTYYIQVRAKDNAGNFSTPAAADGILAAVEVNPIAAAWSKANSTEPFSLRNKIVTAKIGNAFWLEEADRSMAIKVVSSAPVVRGNTVSVAGVLGLSGTQRALIGDVVVNFGGNTVIQPLAVNTRHLMCGDWNASTPGMTGGKGLYNIGLLVKCAGRVTYSNTSDPNNKCFYLDDGSGLNSGGHSGIKVWCGTVTPPTSGVCVVTGILSSDSIGGSIVPVLLIRESGDILIP